MTTSLPLSKWLFEHEVKMETEKWWIIYDKKWERVYINNKEDLADVNNYYPAFSCEELLEMLPRNISIKQYDEKDSVRYQVEFDEGYMKQKTYRYDNKLSEALGLMVKYLIEQEWVYKDGKLVKE